MFLPSPSTTNLYGPNNFAALPLAPSGILGMTLAGQGFPSPGGVSGSLFHQGQAFVQAGSVSLGNAAPGGGTGGGGGLGGGAGPSMGPSGVVSTSTGNLSGVAGDSQVGGTNQGPNCKKADTNPPNDPEVPGLFNATSGSTVSYPASGGSANDGYPHGIMSPPGLTGCPGITKDPKSKLGGPVSCPHPGKPGWANSIVDGAVLGGAGSGSVGL